MGIDDQAHGIIEALYDATFDPAQFQTVAERTRLWLGGNPPLVLVSDRSDGRPLLGALSDIDPDRWREYEAHYYKGDVWLQRAFARPPGSVVMGFDLASRDELATSEWYHDFLNSQDIHDFTGCLADIPTSLAGMLNVFRPRSAEPFSALESAQMAALEPYVSRAFQFRLRLEEVETAARAQQAALDRLPFGVILVDGKGRIAGTNETARKIVARGDGFRPNRKGLEPRKQEDHARLATLIETAIDHHLGRHWGGGGVTSVHRTSLRPPYSVMVCPVPPRADRPDLLGTSRAAAIVFIGDPAARPDPPAAVLAHLFGLTAAEARLAVRIAAGETPAAAADALGVTVGTARNQLKAIMAKTGARRQADLVAILFSSVATLVTPDTERDGQGFAN